MFRPKNVIEKTFYALLPMQIFMILVSSINSIIDGVIASNYIGPDAMTVIALFFPVIKIIETINTVFLGGAQILCGNYIGRNQLKKSSAIFSIDIISILTVGFITTIGCILFSVFTPALFGQDVVLTKSFCDYIRGYSIGIIPLLLITQLSAFLQIERQEKRVYTGMVVMIVLNILLDIFFVSTLKWGLFGLGLATTISNYAFAIILAFYYFLGKSSIKFSFEDISFSDIKEIVRIGIPGAISPFGQTIRATLLNAIMMTYVGNIGIATFSVINTFGCVYWALSAGVTSAVKVLVSIYKGEEDRRGLRDIMKTAMTKGVGLVTIAAIIFILCAPLFTNLYFRNDAGSIYDLTLEGFRMFPVTMPLSCICFIFGNYYQCMGHFKKVNILIMVDSFVSVILFSVLLAPSMGMKGVWLAHILNGVVTTLIILIYTIHYKKSLPSSFDDYLILSDSFGISEDNRIDIQIESWDDVIDLSESIMIFAQSHGIDHKHALRAGICVEEMAGNIIKHGFRPGHSNNIDVRIVYDDNSIRIRLKDNCKAFNPKEMADMLAPEDITHNIGIRLAMRMSKDMSYNTYLGINVLTLVI